MNALLLTDEQVTELANANINSGSDRILEPRVLADGRQILNADVLEDPFFNDPEKPWWPIIAAAPPIELTEADLTEPQI